MFLMHNLEEEYSPYASLHSKVILGVNTCLIVTIRGFFFFWCANFVASKLHVGVAGECRDTVWGNLPSWNNNCLFELFMPLLFSLMWSRLKSKDKFMTRERTAKWCLSFIALFPRLKQGHYTLCRRRCMQSLHLVKLGIIRSGGIHSSATVNCPSSEEIAWEPQFQLLLSEKLACLPVV